MKSLLEIKHLNTNLHFNKEDILIIEDISFSIKEGEVLGIVGESGCGKSITALSIMGLLPSNVKIDKKSIIRFHNDDISKYSAKDMQRIRGNKISMIFQEPMTSLNPVMKIGKQLDEVISLHLNMNKKETRKRALMLIRQVDISNSEEVYNAYPHQLSGGMRQRIMIAMAMACEPQLLIADEPTTALDVTIQEQVLNLISKLQKRNNTSVIMITHDLGVIADICDRVIVMYAGQIVESADVYTLFKNPQHPYTRGLIKSLPINVNNGRLFSIPGNVPNLNERPKGCRFAPRCPFAKEICSTKPPVYELEENHKTACWLLKK
jgi:peptide/nickel transport system ATP-binding protein